MRHSLRFEWASFRSVCVHLPDCKLIRYTGLDSTTNGYFMNPAVPKSMGSRILTTLSATRWNVLFGLLLITGIVFIATTRVQSDRGAASASGSPDTVVNIVAPQENHLAPDFALNTLEDQRIQLSALRGQVVLINIWATWCSPCRAEMPMMQAAYAQYRERGFIVLAVNLREESQTVAQYMQESGLTFPALLDRDGQVSNDYRALVIPSSFFIDKAGVIRAVYRGPMARSVITGTVEQLLAEEP